MDWSHVDYLLSESESALLAKCVQTHMEFVVVFKKLLVHTCILWCFNQLFELSFWRHPFTAGYPLVSKWCNAEFLQICSNEEKRIYILDGIEGE